LLPPPTPGSAGRRRRGADEDDEGVVNVFDTPVGQALLDSLSNGYTREKGLGNGLAEKIHVGRGSPLGVIWPQAADKDKMARRETANDRGEPFSLTVRRALMDSLCYPGYGRAMSRDPEGR
ncbi:unnamed protein product, partial [Ixodes hexagonus]